MHSSTKKKAVLVASRDPSLADVRKQTLELAGYRVIAASSHLDVLTACQREKLHLVLLGYSLPPAEKRRVSAEVRQHCHTPILELYKSEAPTLQASSYLHQHFSDTPIDFMDAVRAIVGSSTGE
jgi:DNA-binding response OmpR family regulator